MNTHPTSLQENLQSLLQNENHHYLRLPSLPCCQHDGEPSSRASCCSCTPFPAARSASSSSNPHTSDISSVANVYHQTESTRCLPITSQQRLQQVQQRQWPETMPREPMELRSSQPNHSGWEFCHLYFNGCFLF